jgi:hypothetical protein
VSGGTGATNARSPKDPYGSLLTPPEVLRARR